MAARWIEKVTGSLEDKKRYRQYKVRREALPVSYRTAIEAVERYLMYAGAIATGEVLVQMLEDLVELFEQSAADGTPLTAVVGEDPVAFAETFLANYSDGQWINKERARLVAAIEAAAAESAAEAPQEGRAKES